MSEHITELLIAPTEILKVTRAITRDELQTELAKRGLRIESNDEAQQSWRGISTDNDGVVLIGKFYADEESILDKGDDIIETGTFILVTPLEAAAPAAEPASPVAGS